MHFVLQCLNFLKNVAFPKYNVPEHAQYGETPRKHLTAQRGKYRLTQGQKAASTPTRERKAQESRAVFSATSAARLLL